MTKATYTIYGDPAGILVARRDDGTLLASAMTGVDGWHVTAKPGGWCQIFVADEPDARLLLNSVAGVLA